MAKYFRALEASKQESSDFLLKNGEKADPTRRFLLDTEVSKFVIADDQRFSEPIPEGSYQNPGYIYSQLISGSSCTSTPYYVSGYISNTCLVNDGYASYSFCDGGKVTKYKYNTTTCGSTSNLYAVEIGNVGCYRSFTETGVVIQSSGCTTSTDTLPLTSVYYGVDEFYSNSACSGKNMSSFTAYINNKCFTMDNVESYYYSFPYKTTYSNPNCQGTGTTTISFTPACTAGDPPTYSTSELIQGMNPTPRPTTNYVPATYITDDGSDDNMTLGLGGIAAVALAISGFVGIIFFLGFCFAVRSGKRSNSADGSGNEMSDNPVGKQYT